MNAPISEPVEQTTNHNPVTHLFCRRCTPNKAGLRKAVCGVWAVSKNTRWPPGAQPDCAVCRDLQGVPCGQRCGVKA